MCGCELWGLEDVVIGMLKATSFGLFNIFRCIKKIVAIVNDGEVCAKFIFKVLRIRQDKALMLRKF